MIPNNSEHPSAAEFVNAISQSYCTAVQKTSGVINHDYAIGGHIIRLSFAGPALISRITPSFNHLLITSTHAIPDLTISIWDTESSGVGMPFLDIWNDCSPRGEVCRFEGSYLSVTRLQTAGVFSVLDTVNKKAFYWAQSADDIPWYECGAPLRSILHAWWCEYNGILLHAASVGTESGGVLLVGKGGSGKSTTALVCMQNGMYYLGDDYCLLVNEKDPIIYSLYCSAKIKHEDTHRFAKMTSTNNNLHENDSDKILYYLNSYPSCKISSSTTLRAILMPRVTGLKDTQIIPASVIEAIHSLAPSAIFQLPCAGQKEFSQISKIASRVKCYWLEVGTDLCQIPGNISKVID